MMRLSTLLLAAALSLALQAHTPLAQGDTDRAGREADESAATVEARRAALSSLLEDARRLREAGGVSGAARALNRAGRLHLRLNSPEDALAVYREALALLRRADDATATVDSLNGLGAAYTRLSKCPEAESRLGRALARSARSGYTAGRAEALRVLSRCQNYGDHSLALATARESLALWQSLGDRRGTAEAYVAVGHYQLAQNDLAGSEQSYEAARGLWRELGSADGQAESLIMLGFIEFRRGDWQDVISLMTQAQNLLDEEAEPYMMGQITACLAEAYIESGSPELGPERYRQAQEFYRRAQSPREVMVMSWGIGRSHYVLREYAESISHLQQALAVAESMNEQAMVAMCNEYLGLNYAATGDQAAALNHFHAALDLYGRVANPMEVARVRALLGHVYAQQGEAERARSYYQRALKTFRGLSDRINESATLYAFGSMELSLNRLAEAEGYLRRSIELTENVRRVSTSRDLAAAFSATVQERYVAYAECLMRRHSAEPSRGLDVLAFESSESSRARSLSELLRATVTRPMPGIDPQLAEQERALRQSLRVKEDEKVALLGRQHKQGELKTLDAELARLEAEYKALDETIRARHPAYGQLTDPDGWTLRRIQEQVVADDETLLVEYSLGVGRSYAWAVTRGGLKSYELPPRALIERAAERVYKLLSVRPEPGREGETAEAVRELSRMVLAPFAGELRDRRRLVVVADGVLNYVPFQILSASPDGGGGDPLVAGHEVVNAPSASILGQLREEAARRRPYPRTLAAFGDPVFRASYATRKGEGSGVEVAGLSRSGEEGLKSNLRGVEVEGDSMNAADAQSLFFAGLELANLRAVAAGADPLVASGFDATRERLQATDLSEFAVLHFATHGWLDPHRPERSGLLLSTVDTEGRERVGFVGLRDIYNLRAPVGLVVLSACRTALGKEVQGEGMIGLTRGFMYAGASGVVSSLWKVDDEATSELMRRFYENLLRRGMTPAEALGAAQNSIRQEPRWRSPFFWAAFTLHGENRQVVRPLGAHGTSLHTKAALSAATLSLLALAACAAWWLRRRRPRASV